MALDFCLITKEGRPMESTPVGPERHEEFFAVAGGTGKTPLLMRMSDYHRDVVYDPTEIKRLAAELKLVIGLNDCPESVAETAMLMLSVCEIADSEGARIEAISDS
jgi:hypothetical protein